MGILLNNFSAFPELATFLKTQPQANIKPTSCSESPSSMPFFPTYSCHTLGHSQSGPGPKKQGTCSKWAWPRLGRRWLKQPCKQSLTHPKRPGFCLFQTFYKIQRGLQKSVPEFKPKSAGSRKGGVFFRALLTGWMEGGARKTGCCPLRSSCSEELYTRSHEV